MLIDVILLLILVVCAQSGYRRGLLMSLMGLLVAVLCCLGATAAQNALTPRATSYLEPRLAAVILPSVETELESHAAQALDEAGEIGFSVGGQSMSLSDFTDFLRQFGLDVEGTVGQGASNALRPAAEAVARAIAHAFAEKLAGAVIFFTAFLVLYLVLHGAALAVNVVDRLPVIHTCNRVGGALLALAGCLLVMVVAAAVCRDGNLLPDGLGPLGQLLLGLADALL